MDSLPKEAKNAFNILTFNCHGLKSSIDYIMKLYNDNDILFLSEHWLLSSEINLIKDKYFKNDWCNLKSSINPTEVLTGRPHGGCGFVCKKVPGVSFKNVQCTNDRLCGVEVRVSQQTVLTVFGVYLPHESHSGGIELYLETMHELQGLIDSCGTIPYMVMGDYNTRLPMAESLSAKWYLSGGFNRRSALLYDFLSDNGLVVANFVYKQHINYTFKNHNSATYIDHIVVSEALLDSINTCKIQCDDDNVSDHLPLYCNVMISCKTSHNAHSSVANKPRVNWSDHNVQTLYCEHLKGSLDTKPLVKIDDVTSNVEAMCTVNNIYVGLCEAIHKASDFVTEDQSIATRCRRKNWWNDDCKAARYRHRLYFHIWRSLGRPPDGQAYQCYRLARKQYRRTCRRAINNGIRKSYDLTYRLFTAKKHQEFWNIIRRSKKDDNNFDAISQEDLCSHFKSKFKSSSPDSAYIHEAQDFVKHKLSLLDNSPTPNMLVSEMEVTRLIKQLKSGCAAGVDNVTPEHLKFSLSSSVPMRLSIMLSLCLRFGCVPDAFKTGLLIPILKKNTLDPSIAAHYRPITISVIMSKLLELYILQNCDEFKPDDAQFGFVKHRGTNTATALVHDISAYCLDRGSTVYLCSLDAEGAFDAIPHEVLFTKAAGSVPDYSWRVLHNWYSRMSVRLRWNQQLSSHIPVQRGTRQGGLTSPFLFNVFYKDLISILGEKNCGITIKNKAYNVFCYADDLLLASTTPSGLQTLIDTAAEYITRQGLRFNPSKTTCMMYGPNTFTSLPSWHISQCALNIEDSMVYLGAGLANDNGASHIQKRIKAAHRAYHSLQHVGLHFKGLAPEIASHIFCMGVQTVLLYGCDSVHINKSNLRKLYTTQGNLIKSMLGLRRSSLTSPLLKALNIKDVSTYIHIQSANLLCSCLLFESKASLFYASILSKQCHTNRVNTLVHRCLNHFISNGLSFMRYVLDDKYKSDVLSQLKGPALGADGIVDSIRTLCADYNTESRDLLQGLLLAF